MTKSIQRSIRPIAVDYNMCVVVYSPNIDFVSAYI